MRIAKASTALLVGFGLVLAGAARADTPEAEVAGIFSDYRSAILAGRGEAAVRFLSESTIDYYAEMRDLALYGSAQAVKSQSLVNQMQVLLLRLRMETNQLQVMSGRQLLVHAIEEGWIGKSSVQRTELGAVRVEGTVAEAKVVVEGQELGATFQFVREANAWRLDLVPTIQASNASLQAAARAKGVPEQAFLLMLVESAVGRKVGPESWNPPLERR